MTNESEIMKEKIVSAEKMQIIMKGCNKIIRSKKLSDDEKAAKITADHNLTEDQIREIFRHGGYEPWRLSNNTANIRRMKQRVIALQKKETTPTSQIDFDGGTIIDDAEDDRVQIDFDTKPGEAMRAELGGAGWRWAPSVALWQRQRTPQALVSAKRITGLI